MVTEMICIFPDKWDKIYFYNHLFIFIFITAVFPQVMQTKKLQQKRNIQS